MLGRFGLFYPQEVKPASQELTILDARALRGYIQSKSYPQTALDVGKYRLGLLLEEKIIQKQNLLQKNPKAEINYAELKRDFYIAYKVNEFLEKPQDYEGINKCLEHTLSSESLLEPIRSVFTDRDGMAQLTLESHDWGLEAYSEYEMEKLFRLFSKMFINVNLPASLPECVKTGTKILGWSWASPSTLHPVIKDLYDQCQKKLELVEKKTVAAQF